MRDPFCPEKMPGEILMSGIFLFGCTSMHSTDAPDAARFTSSGKDPSEENVEPQDLVNINFGRERYH